MHSKEKIKKIRERALLREYINLHITKVIKEQDYGDYYDDPGLGSGGGAYGGDSSGSNVMRLFGIDSIINSLKTAQYAVESTLNKAVGETKLLVKNFIFFAIPFIINKETPNLIDMANKDRQNVNRRLQEIDRKYGDVLKNNDILKQLNTDFKFAAFIASPGLFLAKPLVEKSVGVISSTLDAIIPPREDYGKNDLLKSLEQLFAAPTNGREGAQGRQPQITREQIRNLIVQELAQEPTIQNQGITTTDIAKILSPKAQPTSQTVINAATTNPIVEQIELQPSTPAPAARAQSLGLLQTELGKEFVEKFKKYVSFLKNPTEVAKAISDSQLVKDIQNTSIETINRFVDSAINDINTNFTPEAIKKKIEENKKAIAADVSERFPSQQVPEFDKLLAQNQNDFQKEVLTLKNNIIQKYVVNLQEYEKQSNSPELKAAVKDGIDKLNRLR